MDLIERVREHGVVGAGGAGFPTYVKLGAAVDTLVVNAAECEPLLHKDKEILRRHADLVIAGARLAREAVGAARIIVGIKAKYSSVIEAIRRCDDCGDLEIHPLGDFYPAGDEFVLVRETTGRVIPPGGLPLDVGVMTSNVETLFNVARDRPVITKFLTVGGAVRRPCTVEAPLGVSFAHLLEAAGGPSVERFAVIAGGVMMGTLVEDLSTPVTRTTGGLLVFPEDHRLVARYRRDWSAVARIGRSACDQCSFCTELCPRYLLGHPIQPHISMRTLGFALWEPEYAAHNAFCCECNLCSLYSCPEDLDPKEVCATLKRRAREAGVRWEGTGRGPHPMVEYRRAPLTRLFAKLDLNRFENRGPLTPLAPPERVRILLQQHIGAPARPVVAVGDRVRAGQVLGRPPEDALGVPIHASIDGRVVAVESSWIELEREG
jgi:Na+-translocating ferredoxin:NAD+ oxidoreductase RnfC subunit